MEKLDRKHRTGHRSHISGRKRGYGARIKDKLVERTKRLEAEILKKQMEKGRV